MADLFNELSNTVFKKCAEVYLASGREFCAYSCQFCDGIFRMPGLEQHMLQVHKDILDGATHMQIGDRHGQFNLEANAERPPCNSTNAEYTNDDERLKSIIAAKESGEDATDIKPLELSNDNENLPAMPSHPCNNLHAMKILATQVEGHNSAISIVKEASQHTGEMEDYAICPSSASSVSSSKKPKKAKRKLLTNNSRMDIQAVAAKQKAQQNSAEIMNFLLLTNENKENIDPNVAAFEAAVSKSSKKERIQLKHKSKHDKKSSVQQIQQQKPSQQALQQRNSLNTTFERACQGSTFGPTFITETMYRRGYLKVNVTHSELEASVRESESLLASHSRSCSPITVPNNTKYPAYVMDNGENTPPHTNEYTVTTATVSPVSSPFSSPETSAQERRRFRNDILERMMRDMDDSEGDTADADETFCKSLRH